jgi:hypothetical protein
MKLKKNITLTHIILTLLCSWAITYNTVAQPDTWHTGVVVLNSGDTLEGVHFNYNLKTNLLQVNQANTLKAYNASQIQYFEYLDKEFNYYRRFFTYKYALYSRGYATPVFFEKAYQGTYLSLLLRETLVIDSQPIFDPFMGRTVFVNQPRVVYNFYFMSPDGNIRFYDGTRKGLLNLLKDQQNEIKAYAKEQKMSYNTVSHIIEVLRYYNGLKNKQLTEK